MASNHNINSDLQQLANHYHSGELNTNEYRAKRRVVLDSLVKAPAPQKKVTPQTRKVRKAKYLGLALLVISVAALLLFGFKFNH